MHEECSLFVHLLQKNIYKYKKYKTQYNIIDFLILLFFKFHFIFLYFRDWGLMWWSNKNPFFVG